MAFKRGFCKADMSCDPELLFAEMEAEDLPDVLAIEGAVSAVPWTENMFRRELTVPAARNLTARIEGATIAGYINYWMIAGEIHIHNIAVRSDLQRRGIASALLGEMLARAHREGAKCATLEVRPSNLRARRLYERFGFVVEGRRPLYYDDTKEDALIMWAHFNEEQDDKR